ncbi:hypothetical protein Tco_0957161, partial [Tanacetum coccineum]
TIDEYELAPGSLTSLSDWITPIPEDYNSHLVSLSQESNDSTLALSCVTPTVVTMESFPEPGSSSSVFATFRVIFPESNDTLPPAVVLEPYGLPDSVLSHQGRENELTIDNYYGSPDSFFYIVNNDDGSVQLEAESEKGCFVYNDGGVVKLKFDSSDGSDNEFLKATSFVIHDGISHYHPISFVAAGFQRNYLLQPLFSLRDEHYSVYFNIDPYINLNTNAGDNDEDEVQEIRRPGAGTKRELSGSSTMNDDALARLMVTELST